MKFNIFLFAVATIVLFAGCGAKPENNEPSGGASPGPSGQSSQTGQQEKGFLGYVVKKEAGRILVVDSISKDYSSSGGMKNYYSAIWFSKAPSNVEIGQKVEVWAKGGIAESYPAQAEADRLVTVPAFEHEGAVLSEAEAVRKALASPKIAEVNGVPAIKEVKFESSASVWTVYIARNGEEETMEIQVEDIPKQELGETPPQPVIIADGKSVTVYQSSYEITENSFRAPQEKGTYYYSLSANWMKDKETISEGSSSYVFAIEVTGD